MMSDGVVPGVLVDYLLLQDAVRQQAESKCGDMENIQVAKAVSIGALDHQNAPGSKHSYQLSHRLSRIRNVL